MSKKFLKELRNTFREGVFQRDKYQCKICGKPESPECHLDAHHITDRHDMPNDGYALSNGITLCPQHHLDAEEFHQSNQTKWVRGFRPEDLYTLIGSSYQIAHHDCLGLTHPTKK